MVRKPRVHTDRRFLAMLDTLILANLAQPEFGVVELAKGMAYGRRQLLRHVRRLTGLSPSEYVRAKRMAQAHAMLIRGVADTVAEAAARVGMNRSAFSRSYAAHHGRAPCQDLWPSGVPDGFTTDPVDPVRYVAPGDFRVAVRDFLAAFGPARERRLVGSGESARTPAEPGAGGRAGEA